MIKYFYRSKKIFSGFTDHQKMIYHGKSLPRIRADAEKSKSFFLPVIHVIIRIHHPNCPGADRGDICHSHLDRVSIDCLYL